ncbi:MAG TPA: tetratricopeptide repeat protein [Vicinamibacteria bacterium]|nr:tetratricopeptide repeat protein [Vicinamibacteria bacterium]
MFRPPPIVLAAFLGAASPAAGAQAPAPAPSAAAASSDLQALVNRAFALHQAGDVEGAVQAYEEAIRLGADGPVVRSNLGAALARLGRYDEAIEEYRRALAADGANVAIRRNLALAYYKAGRMSEAAREADAVLEAQPGSDPSRVLLADCLFRLGQTARVVELLKPLAERAAPERAVSYLLGMALLAEGRVGEAQTAIDRVLRDDSPEAHVFLGMMYMKDKDCRRAQPEIDRALRANPRLPLVNFVTGQCLMADERSDWAGAMAAFRRELEIDPNHFESNLLLGNLLREGARHEEALPYLERASRLRPDDLRAPFSLGAVYVALGRTEEALPLLERVAAAAPDHLETQMQLAVVYHRLGRTADEARARAAVGRLQSESETRFFTGVSDSLARLLGKTSPPDPKPAPERP